jgi:ribonuclease P protein component
MFKKSQRLDRAAFTHYFKTGRRFQSPNLTIVYTPGVPFQVSAVVGKKVSKEAVGRNRIRRRLYAATKRFVSAETVITGVHIIIAKPTTVKITRLALAAETDELLTLAHPPKAR